MISSINQCISDIRRNPMYSLFLFIPIVLISFMFFCGRVIDTSLQKGMDNMEKRLGADAMIVPKGAKDEASDLILEGARGEFYFDHLIYDSVSDVKGVKEAAYQFFLKSLSKDCCSSEVEIVFLDWDSDFLIKPWIKEYQQEMKQNMVVVGNQVETEENGVLKLFGKDYKVAARMAKTGTNLDKSVYFTFDSMKDVVADAKKSGSFISENQENENLISSVFINMEEGGNVQDVIDEIKKENYEFEVVYPKQMAKSLTMNLQGIYGVLHSMVILSGILLTVVLIIVNVVIANERKREIALLNMFNVGKAGILKILNKSIILISISGSLLGCALGGLIILPFGNYIGYKLQMAYLSPGIAGLSGICVVIVFLMLVIATVTGILPTLYISNIEPYIALRKEGE